MGKITSFRFQERDGHRLKTVLYRVVWFAPERPWRQGRPARRYRALSARAQRGNAGGTAESIRLFAPAVGAEGRFVVSRRMYEKKMDTLDGPGAVRRAAGRVAAAFV